MGTAGPSGGAALGQSTGLKRRQHLMRLLRPLLLPPPPSSQHQTPSRMVITAAPSFAAALAKHVKTALLHACFVLKVHMSSKSKTVKLAAARAAAALPLRLTVSEFALLKLRESFVKGQVTLSVCICECQWRRHC